MGLGFIVVPVGVWDLEGRTLWSFFSLFFYHLFC